MDVIRRFPTGIISGVFLEILTRATVGLIKKVIPRKKVGF